MTASISVEHVDISLATYQQNAGILFGSGGLGPIVPAKFSILLTKSTNPSKHGIQITLGNSMIDYLKEAPSLTSGSNFVLTFSGGVALLLAPSRSMIGILSWEPSEPGVSWRLCS